MSNKFCMTAEENLMYAKRNIVDSIYSEARLEGVGVTYPDTQEIFDGRAVAGLTIEETIKVNNLKHAWQFVLDNIDYPLNLRFIRQINSEIGAGIVINAGNLRMVDVKIGGTTWKPEIPNEDNVNKQISDIMDNYELSATEKATSMMLFIMRTQMFMDGNKRTAQLVANKIMIDGGAGIINIPVDSQREFISDLLDYYETNDSSTITRFVYDKCLDGYNSQDIINHSDLLDLTDKSNTQKR